MNNEIGTLGRLFPELLQQCRAGADIGTKRNTLSVSVAKIQPVRRMRKQKSQKR